jgi:hypothetical protein
MPGKIDHHGADEIRVIGIFTGAPKHYGVSDELNPRRFAADFANILDEAFTPAG